MIRLSSRTRTVRVFVAGIIAVAMGLASLAVNPAPAIAGEARAIAFPVEGLVSYSSTFGAPRSGGRSHAGNDLMGSKMQPLLAAATGRISFLRVDSSGLSGNMLSITDAQGWQYRYMHINNDTPGTDDGLNPLQFAFFPGIAQGARVLAGQRIAYLGDSGNAEGTAPHLHFEIVRPDGIAIDPYASLQGASRSPAWTGRSVAANPRGGYYILTGDGTVHAYDGATHYGQPQFGFDIARDIAVMPDGRGYMILDGWGGVHRYGSAGVAVAAGLPNPYFGFDIARSIDLSPAGDAMVVLDGWGGVHLAGNAPEGTKSYWPGWDIARSVSFTTTGKGMYVLDGWGGVHTSGDALVARHPYWNGWDIARGIVATSTTEGSGYAVLDGFGGIHTVGKAPKGPAGSWDARNKMAAFDLMNGRYFTISRDGTNRRW